jgi:uncharacterized protein YyaL (SSP411 family)
MSNHLAGASSPYLLQHATNPVDWYPWGDEALEKAQNEDKPIFLSIGYAACHWCHVMAHESFENKSTADFLNEHFVSIKVDREERPDLDSIYMNFVVSTTGAGGWPLSIFLTPDGKPFYGGTYFPPFRSHNLPSFIEVLDSIARVWQTNRSAILSSSDKLANNLKTRPSTPPAPVNLSPELLQQAVHTIVQSYDWQNGGWGTAPKFPQSMPIEFLLSQASRGDQASLNMAEHALNSMGQGGIYDILGGGFARYSVDTTWLVPHFEKMLYDNAQLALVYLYAFQLTAKPSYREVCEATLDFVLCQLTGSSGGFYSSLDADSEGEEGKYYLWAFQEIRSALVDSADTDLFMAAYGVSESGNFDGRNILRRTMTGKELADRFHTEESAILPRLAALKKRLLEVRNGRVPPATDDKVLAAWNALMLSALAKAGRALGRQDYLVAATRNAAFILENMYQDGRLYRSWRDGIARHDAYLEDYAGLGLALLSLYQADPLPRWYLASCQLLEQILLHFTDPKGGFFDTSDTHEALLYRPKEVQDASTPSGNALAATLLLKLAAYEGRTDWRQLAGDLLSANLGIILRYPTAFSQWLIALDFYLGPAHEVAIVGEPSDSSTLSLLQPLWSGYYPRVLLSASAYPPPPGSPVLLNDRVMLHGKATAYVCQDFVCQLPVNEPSAMLAQL